MKREIVTGIVAASATALATVGFAQAQSDTQVPQQQQGQPEQSQQQMPQASGRQDPRTQGQTTPGDQPAQGQSQQQARQQSQQQQDQPLPDYEPGASVILSGTIASIENEQFKLDYGQEQDVTVDLDDWDLSGELRERLSEGQQVTVSGTIDENWNERRAIDADNIYVTTDYTYYYIVDENPAYTAQQSRRETERDGTFLSTRGEVKEVSENQITLESQGNTIQVDTSELGYDPLDEEGVQQIKQGDRVYVFGDIDENFFETGTMSAESLISLSEQGRMDQRDEQGIQEPGQQQQSQPDIRDPGQQQDQQPTN